MKFKLFSLVLVLALALGALGVQPAFAQNPAYQTAFTTSITYQNVDTAATTSLEVWFYPNPDTTTPIIIERDPLPAGAGTSLFLGSLSNIDAGFKGSAIMQSDKLLVATLVQLPQNSTTVKNRPLSNGFAQGSPTILLATVLKSQFNTHSVFSIQNVDTEENTITIKYYDISADNIYTDTATIAPGAAFYVDAGLESNLPTPFNGSAIVSAKRGDNSNGSIISSVMELSTNGVAARAFESVSGGANTVFMATANCQLGASQATSNYAIQNASLTESASVTVTYLGNQATKTSDPVELGPGAKASFNTCSVMAAGFTGAATITSTGAPIVAVGKVGGNGPSTAFLGQASGTAKLALPYVRFTNSCWGVTGGACGANGRQRTNIAVQNVGAASIPVGGITIEYKDINGAVVATYSNKVAIAVGAKWNTNAFNTEGTTTAAAAEFGYVGGTGGGAVITCSAPSCQIQAVARVSTLVTPATGFTASEDYNAIDIP